MVPRASVQATESTLPPAAAPVAENMDKPEPLTQLPRDKTAAMGPRVSVPTIDIPLPRISELSTDKPLPKIPVQEMLYKMPGSDERPLDRPEPPRRATAPDIPNSNTLSPLANPSTSTIPFRPRTRSPYARGHARSRSSQGTLSAPQMARAHSSPTADSNGRFIARPSSPLLGPSVRHRSPLRKPSDETFSSFGNSLDIDQTISETAELDLTPRATTDYDSMPASPSLSNHSTFPRSRRRPASPLAQITASAFSTTTPRGGTTLRASTSTPQLAPSHYNESYPSLYSTSSSSIPSTPTSLRSRSPSISSLETIPDSPAAEAEAEDLAKLKAAADREDQNEDGVRRRAGTDVGGRPSAGSRDKRKRWSVCGAERRGDLNLETIWET